MKKVILMTLFCASSFASVNIKQPPKQGHGFDNINKREEYRYFGHKNENIWHEFGRPFWNGQSTRATIIEQKTVKKMAAPQRPVSKDSDNDGILDRMDQCPNTLKGIEVNALGCKKSRKENLTLNIKFDLNKASILSDYTKAINKLGNALSRNQDLSIEIQGHTDTSGNDDYNMHLSQSRAKAVKSYLIEKYSISKERLISKGFGETLPQYNNATRDGRKKNRRVEIKILN